MDIGQVLVYLLNKRLKDVEEQSFVPRSFAWCALCKEETELCCLVLKCPSGAPLTKSLSLRLLPGHSGQQGLRRQPMSGWRHPGHRGIPGQGDAALWSPEQDQRVHQQALPHHRKVKFRNQKHAHRQVLRPLEETPAQYNESNTSAFPVLVKRMAPFLCETAADLVLNLKFRGHCGGCCWCLYRVNEWAQYPQCTVVLHCSSSHPVKHFTIGKKNILLGFFSVCLNIYARLTSNQLRCCGATGAHLSCVAELTSGFFAPHTLALQRSSAWCATIVSIISIRT